MTTLRSQPAKRRRSAKWQSLSGRERQVLECLSLGLSNKEIGGRLGLSQFTVKNHLARIFTKLGVHSRTAAVIAYLQA